MTLLSSLSLLRKNSTYKDVKKQYLKVQIFYPKSDKNLANQRQNKTGGYDIIPIMSAGEVEYVREDLTGRRYGRLTVCREIKQAEKSRRHYWLCRCDCGKEKTVEESHLKTGHTKSCGCYRKELPSSLLLSTAALSLPSTLPGAHICSNSCSRISSQAFR